MKAILVLLFVVGYTLGDLELVYPPMVAGWLAVGVDIMRDRFR